MDASFFWKGLLLGFSIAAPVGPIGVLCIRRTIAEGRASGLVSGLGAATADALYGSVAGFGLTFVSDLLIGQRTWFSLIGGLFLGYLGVKTFISQPATLAASAQGGNLWRAYLSTWLLTLTNPMTILSFAAAFAGLGIVGTTEGYLAPSLLISGVFAGSVAWWLLLTTAVQLLRKRLAVFRSMSDTAPWRWLNRISGSILLGFGVWSLLGLIRSWL
jgi:threonine/homoserine/homoserine lactone efflux protein